MVDGGPIKRGWDRSCSGSGGDEGASGEFGGRVGCINGSEQVNGNEMIDKVGTKLKGAASGQRVGIKTGGSSHMKGGDDGGWC